MPTSSGWGKASRSHSFLNNITLSKSIITILNFQFYSKALWKWTIYLFSRCFVHFFENYNSVVRLRLQKLIWLNQLQPVTVHLDTILKMIDLALVISSGCLQCMSKKKHHLIILQYINDQQCHDPPASILLGANYSTLPDS